MAYGNVTNALTQQKLPGVDPERMQNEVRRYELFGNTPGYGGITPEQYRQYTQSLGVEGTGAGNQTASVISGGGQTGQAAFGGTVAQPATNGPSSAQPQAASSSYYPSSWESLTPDQRAIYGYGGPDAELAFNKARDFNLINNQQYIDNGLATQVDPAILVKLQAARAANPTGRVLQGEGESGQTFTLDPAWSADGYSIDEKGNIGKMLQRETWGQDVNASYGPDGRLVGINSGDSTALGLAKFGLASVGAYYGVQGADALVNGNVLASTGGYADPIVFTGAEGTGAAAGGAGAGAGASSLGQTAAQGAGSSAVSQAIQPGGANPGNPGTGIFSNVKDALPLVGAAATLASGGGSARAPAAPDYVKAAIATSNSGRYDERTPYGTVTWSLRPGADPNNPQPGDYIRTTNFSPEQQRLYDLNTSNQLQAGQVGGQQLAELGQGRQSVQDALYRRATQYYDQNFGDQENQLRTRLTNQGLNEGTEAFTRELRNFRQGRDTAYADATDRAITGADQQENNAVARIVNILNLSKATTPTSGNSAGGAGTDLLSAANQSYTANLGATNAQNARDAQQQNALLQLVLGGMKYYGG